MVCFYFGPGVRVEVVPDGSPADVGRGHVHGELLVAGGRTVQQAGSRGSGVGRTPPTASHCRQKRTRTGLDRRYTK